VPVRKLADRLDVWLLKEAWDNVLIDFLSKLETIVSERDGFEPLVRGEECCDPPPPWP